MLQGVTGLKGKRDAEYRKRGGGWGVILTYVHKVLLHVVGKVLEHCNLANKVFRDLTCGEDSALAQLCIVMDCPVEKRRK